MSDVQIVRETWVCLLSLSLSLCVVVVVVVEGGEEEGGVEEKETETNRAIWAKVSLRITGAGQLHQAQRMFGGIDKVLLLTHSQTENGEDPLVSLVNL